MEIFIFILKGFTAILLSLATILLIWFTAQKIMQHWRIYKINSKLRVIGTIVYDSNLPLTGFLSFQTGGQKHWFEFEDGKLKQIDVHMSDKAWFTIYKQSNGIWYASSYNKKGRLIEEAVFSTLYGCKISKCHEVDRLSKVFTNLKPLFNVVNEL